MITAKETLGRMLREQPHWRIGLMDFVDDVRRRKDPRAIAESFDFAEGTRLTALLAAVIDQLCLELAWEPPEWTARVPPAPRAWFVSEMDSLKAIALVESPPAFKARRVFVLENFLHRV